MSKYNNAKIYKITDNDYNKCYIGSTCESLSQRLARHRYNYHNAKQWNTLTSANRLFDEFGMENCKIELIECFPCESREELLKREGFHIKNNNCINRCVAGRTIEEWKEDNKEHYQHMRKEYSIKNKEYICNKTKEYYQKNRDSILEKRKIKVECNCGASITKDRLRLHERSKRHIAFMNNNNNL